jgi:uncharacterized protein (DUF1501 family)
MTDAYGDTSHLAQSSSGSAADAAYRCCEEYEEYRRAQWSLRHTRRDFLKTTIGAMAAAPMMPHMLLSSHLASRVQPANNDPILVVLQLAGGNDGLNTIVPYGSGLYYQDRPTVGVAAKSVLPIDNMVGFHPNLAGVKTLYDQGKVAIVQGAGYANPSRSHFQGTAIWETADPTGEQTTGWLGRFLDAELAGAPNPLSAISLGALMPLTLLSQRSPVTAIESVNSYRFLVNRTSGPNILRSYQTMMAGSSAVVPPYINLMRAAGRDAQTGVQDLQTIATKYTSKVKYPQNPLSVQLQLVSQLIAANLGTRIFHVSLGGFDDHAAEVNQHARLMQDLGETLPAFMQDLTAQGKTDQVLIMTFSEFGRRVKENAGRGTDHGTAAPMFVMGNKVKGGLYGKDPILNSLDTNGDLIYGVDFRSVYGTVLDGWMGGNSQTILGGSYERLPFL